jgi:hypothetical protein
MVKAIVMPKQGNTVETCQIVEWKKDVGDMISQGDIICLVETDKATLEVESPSARPGRALRSSGPRSQRTEAMAGASQPKGSSQPFLAEQRGKAERRLRYLLVPGGWQTTGALPGAPSMERARGAESSRGM